MEYLQAVDFLQLNDMVDAVSKLISHKEITNDNVFDVLELTQSIKAPVLQNGCLKCIKENINEPNIKSKLSTLPKETLVQVLSEPRPDLKDEHKRKMNQMEVSITFLEILYSTLEANGDLENLNYYFDRCFQKEHLYFFATLDKAAGKNKMDVSDTVNPYWLEPKENICSRSSKETNFQVNASFPHEAIEDLDIFLAQVDTFSFITSGQVSHLKVLKIFEWYN